MLSKIGVLSAKKMCAENNDLKNPMISPLFGRFNNLKSRLGKAEGGIMNVNMNKGQLGETLHG